MIFIKSKKYLEKNWSKLPLTDLAKELNISLIETLELALSLNLGIIDTPNIGRTWTKDEDAFLKNNSESLFVREASNLLYRSHQATYQRVKLLGLEKMITK